MCSSLVLSALVAVGCGDESTESRKDLPSNVGELRSELARDTSPDVDDASFSQLAKDNRDFATRLYQELRKDEEGNLFFSPFSISSALAMTYAGANGNTRTEMAEALSFRLPAAQLFPAFNRTDLALASRGEGATGKDGAPFQLSVVNSAWVQKDFAFESTYLDTLAVHFGAGIYQLDFQQNPEPSRETINAWVEEKTGDRIQNLLSKGSVDSLTRLVLTNAAYFNASWRTPFTKNATKDETFRAPSGDVKVPTMHGTMFTSYGEGEGYKAALFPYSANELDMLVIVPDAGTFEAFDAGFNVDKLDAVVASATQSFDVQITMPRFEFRSALNLRAPLESLGMVDAFEAGRADFSGMTGTRELSITGVVHQAFVSVDEEGTEAAAATGVIAGATSLPQTVEFKVDRPFLFAIRDRPTGTMLFMGRVLDPSR